jgi:hypothetical protein
MLPLTSNHEQHPLGLLTLLVTCRRLERRVADAATFEYETLTSNTVDELAIIQFTA